LVMAICRSRTCRITCAAATLSVKMAASPALPAGRVRAKASLSSLTRTTNGAAHALRLRLGIERSEEPDWTDRATTPLGAAKKLAAPCDRIGRDDEDEDQADEDNLDLKDERDRGADPAFAEIDALWSGRAKSSTPGTIYPPTRLAKT
jgi:hypothetical protein